MGHANQEAAGFTEAANSMKCILDALSGHCKPRSNETVAASAYKEQLQGDLGQSKYVQKCKAVTAL